MRDLLCHLCDGYSWDDTETRKTHITKTWAFSSYALYSHKTGWTSKVNDKEEKWLILEASLMIHSMWYHSILKNEVNLPPRNFCTSQPLIKYLVGKTIFIYNILYQYILPIQTLFMYRILDAYILYYICILFTHAHLSTIPCPFDSASLQVAGWASTSVLPFHHQPKQIEDAARVGTIFQRRDSWCYGVGIAGDVSFQDEPLKPSPSVYYFKGSICAI